ncbi:MAG: succinylglutamate desuccinylase/aspartoacylase family protein [Fuerstiella sp.]
MTASRKRSPVDVWNGRQILPGDSGDIDLAVSESYSGMTVRIPIHIRRSAEEGPSVFVTAALHGDEINGTGAVCRLLQDDGLHLRRGTVIFVPVLNILGFDRHSRYLPDRRDLNRCFPGSGTGSLASRMARVIFDEIVSRADYGIDLHTAALRRTNYPNVRADMNDPGARQLAEAFGCEVIMNGKGPKGAFRREACRVGCPTVIMEGGEVWKVEPTIVESSIRGIRNVLRSLNMLDGDQESPDYQVVVDRSRWIRAESGGFLHFHIQPGDIVDKGQVLTTNTNLLGREQGQLHAPFDGVVLGLTTIPAVSPGEPVCHIGKLPKGLSADSLRKKRRKGDLEHRLVNQLSSNVTVVDPT